MTHKGAARGGERPGSVGWQVQIPLSQDVGQALGECRTGGGHGATCRALLLTFTCPPWGAPHGR